MMPRQFSGNKTKDIVYYKLNNTIVYSKNRNMSLNNINFNYIVIYKNKYYKLASMYHYYNTDISKFKKVDWYVYYQAKLPIIYHDELYAQHMVC